MNRQLFVPIAASFLITACGGGGGGSPAPVVSPDPSLEITSNNATQVAKVAYEAALSSLQSGDAGGGFFIGSTSGPASKLDSGVAMLAKSGTGSSVSQVPIPEETTQCLVSGSSTVSGEIADIITPTLSAGDFVLIVFNACDDGDGEVTNGSVRADIDAFSGDLLSEQFSITMTLTLANFQVSIFENQSTTVTDVVNSNGSVTVALDATNFPFVSSSVSGDSLVVDSNTSSESLTNFSANHTSDGNFIPAPYTSSSAGTLDSSQLAGIISYSNRVQFAGFGVDFPSSGEFRVVGLNSSLLLVAEDNVNVRIEIDLGADGTIDETINTTWAELTAS